MLQPWSILQVKPIEERVFKCYGCHSFYVKRRHGRRRRLGHCPRCGSIWCMEFRHEHA